MTRIKTGGVLALFIALIVYLWGIWLLLLGWALTLVICYEFLSVALPPYRVTSTHHSINERIDTWSLLRHNSALLYTVILGLIPTLYLLVGTAGMLWGLVVVVLFTLLFEMRRFEWSIHEEGARDVLSAISLTLCYPLMFGTICLVGISTVLARLGDHSWRFFGWYLLIVVLNDIGAYFTGRSFGKTKLSPRVSPNKTAEGALGGFVLALLLALPVACLLQTPLAEGVIIVSAILISALAQLGDLVESFIKRAFEVKDMSGFLPGHGGVFDRVDSHLFAAPVIILLAELL